MQGAEEEWGLRGGGGVASERGEMRRARPFEDAPFSHSASELTSHLYSRLISTHVSSLLTSHLYSRLISTHVSSLDPASRIPLLHSASGRTPGSRIPLPHPASGNIGSILPTHFFSAAGPHPNIPRVAPPIRLGT